MFRLAYSQQIIADNVHLAAVNVLTKFATENTENYQHLYMSLLNR